MTDKKKKEKKSMDNGSEILQEKEFKDNSDIPNANEMKKPSGDEKKVNFSEDEIPENQNMDSKSEEKDKKLSELELQNRELEEKLLRLAAEFDNYKKRMSRDIARQTEMIRERVLIAVLPVADDLDRLLVHENNKKETSVDGVRMIRKKLAQVLKSFEVEPFESVGDVFDPECHDAMMTRESEKSEDPTVLEEFEKGYKIGDKVLRHARVVVSSTE